MSKRYEVRHAMDIDTVLGVLTVGDDDIAKSWAGKDGYVLRGAGGLNIGEVMGRWRNLIFKEVGGGKETTVEKEAEVEVAAGDIIKTDPAKRLVFGWAYVTHDKDGNLNIDKSGDFADDIEEIEKSAYDYVLRSRKGDADHTSVATSDLVESIVFTPEKIEKMGLPAGSIPHGWWIGFKVQDDETWARVERKELTSFSIHGKGTRAKVEE
jgi:hypothetical protein